VQRFSLLGFAAFAFTVVAVACGPVDGFGGLPADAGSPGSSPAAGPTATGPTITIVAPPPSAELQFEDEDDEHHGDDRVQIEVRVERAMLAEAGHCGAIAACGHLVLLIDGNACGTPNARSSSPRFEGAFGRCGKVSGPHEIVVQLVDDRGDVLARSAPVVVAVRLLGRHGGEDDGDHDHGGDDDHGGGDDDHGGDHHGGH